MVRLLQAKNFRFEPPNIIPFNPTMVRLLHISLLHKRSRKLHFQSHNGAIAALETQSRLVGWEYFQSHNGAIAARRAIKYVVNEVELSIPQWCDCCPYLDTMNLLINILSIPQWCDCCFLLSTNPAIETCLSIPQWCDCCVKKLRLLRLRM